MIKIPDSLKARFSSSLARNKIPQKYQIQYLEWLRYYLDFCHKYGFNESALASLPRFIRKLEEKKQTRSQQDQAREDIHVYYELISSKSENKKMELRRPAPKSGSVKEAQDSYRSVPQNSGLRTGAGRRDSGQIMSRHAGEKGSWESAYRQLSNEIKVRHYSPKTLKSYTTWVRKMQYVTTISRSPL